MKSGKRKIDHIVYGVSNLDDAIKTIKTKLGVAPTTGGYHQTFGTKNALLKLNNGMYFELLAIDHTNKNVKPPRWMGIDLLTENKIIRWAVISNTLEQDVESLEKYTAGLGNIASGSRVLPNGQNLEWQLTLPAAKPEVELIPFCIDWTRSEAHPSEQLSNSTCELIELYGKHPKPELFSNIFDEMGIVLRIEKSQDIELKAILQCPNGIIEL